MTDRALSIFVSYASYDNMSSDPEERWLDRLLQFLKPLELEGKVAAWSDSQLSVGSSWHPEIRKSLDVARVAILLVSPAFLASEFIRNEEIPRLLKTVDSDSAPSEKGEAESILVLPILIRPCLIDKVEFSIVDRNGNNQKACLADFQYVPKKNPMNGLSQFEQDKQLEAVARRIIEVLEVGPIETVEDDPNREADSKGLSDSDDSSTGLKTKVYRFLSSHQMFWFDALRIKTWGSGQQGYRIFEDFKVHEIERQLSELASTQKIKVRAGKKGNVYRALSNTPHESEP